MLPTCCTGGGTELAGHGAEAKVAALMFSGRRAIVKQRVRKTWRHPVLDEKLTKRRLLQEARCLYKCRKAGVTTPTLFSVDADNDRIYMEEIIGQSVKSFLIDQAAAGGTVYLSDDTHEPLIIISSIYSQVCNLSASRA
jgi:Kae1-associated kinase Bud32